MIKKILVIIFSHIARSNIHWIFAVILINGSDNFSQTIYKSPKIKINDYGSREQTATISTNIISLNLHDSIISVQSEHPRVEEFLNHQNQFEITKSFGTGVTTKVYFTTTEYIFTFDLKLRAIIISKKEISPMLHSVWFEEITN